MQHLLDLVLSLSSLSTASASLYRQDWPLYEEWSSRRDHRDSPRKHRSNRGIFQLPHSHSTPPLATTFHAALQYQTF